MWTDAESASDLGQYLTIELHRSPPIGPRTGGVVLARAKDIGMPGPILATEIRVAANLESLRPVLRTGAVNKRTIRWFAATIVPSRAGGPSRP